MLLHYKKLGEEEAPPLFILHGVFGMLDNWLSLGKRWAEHNTVYLIDARNHGHSEHSDVLDYESMANDILELMNHLDIEKVNLLGHSMGGKTVMKFSILHPERVEKLIVIDIGPKEYPMHHQRILKGLMSLNLNEINSRTEASNVLSEWIPEVGIRQFLLKNLYWIEKGKLAFRMNLPVINKNMIHVLESVGYDTVETPTLFIRGLESDYIVDEDIPSIQLQFLDSEVIDVPEAGHWVHAQQPELLYQSVVDFLEE